MDKFLLCFRVQLWYEHFVAIFAFTMFNRWFIFPFFIFVSIRRSTWICVHKIQDITLRNTSFLNLLAVNIKVIRFIIASSIRIDNSFFQ